MNLCWKEYGKTLEAKGDKGIWRIDPAGAWWLLSLQAPFTRGMMPQGRFVEPVRAALHAQEREDGETLSPATEKL